MRRKKFFKTRDDARTYLRGYEPQYVTDPRKDQMRVFRVKYPRCGRKYFVGTLFELDVVRFS